MKRYLSLLLLTGTLAAQTADYPINELFAKRRSLYSLKRTLSSDALLKKLSHLFEAARWAPSCYNNQPWRFIYGVHGTPQWNRLLNLLVPFNKKWASNAGALVLVISKTTFDSGKPASTHAFDTGLATAQLILQATDMGLVAHPLSGFDKEKTQKEFKLSKEYEPIAIIAIGEKASIKEADKELAERDKKETTRKSRTQIASDKNLPTG